MFDKDEIISLRNKCSEVFEKLNIKEYSSAKISLLGKYSTRIHKNPNLLNPLLKEK